MDMTLRWYGEGNDSVTLDQIRQIPGVTGVITALHVFLQEKHGRMKTS